MRKSIPTHRICITVPALFYDSLTEMAEITGLSRSRIAWLRLRKSRCTIVPTEVTKTLRSIERMLRTGKGLSYADRAMIEQDLSRIRNFLKDDEK